jgi:glycosyltransferase involved in cell wall biosynthesis
MPRVRILQLVSGKQPNGAVLQCIALIRQMLRRGHQITLVCRPGAWIAEELSGDRVDVVESDLHRWPLDELQRLTRLIRDRRIQLLHTHMSRAHSVGVLLRSLSHTPCVATAHCRTFRPDWRFNDYVIANSEATRRFYCRWGLVSPRRIEVIPYLIDVDSFARVSAAESAQFRQALGVSERTPLLGIVGDVYPRKGHLYVVRALPEILAAVPDARLVIVGNAVPSYRARVLREAQALGVGDKIIWTGYRKDIAVVMKSLDICVSAALEEALGLTMPEALAAERAVVATNVGGLPENVVDGETGILVPPAEPPALARAIVQLLTDPEGRARLGENGRRRVRDRYRTTRDVERIEQLFSQMLRPRVASRPPWPKTLEMAERPLAP